MQRGKIMSNVNNEYWKKYQPQQHSQKYWKSKYKPKLHDQEYYLKKYVYAQEEKATSGQSKPKYYRMRELPLVEKLMLIFVLFLILVKNFA